MNLSFWGKVRPNLRVLHPFTTWVDIPSTCSCPFLSLPLGLDIHTTPQKIWGVECGEASTEDCSLPALHQGLRAPPTGIAAWTRRRRAQQTSSASSYAPSTWHDAWVGQSREEPGAACAPAAAVPCAASSPAGLRRSPMRCSSADVKAQRAPSAGARLSRPPARSRAPGRRCPPA